jgi:hypothetical protein
MAAGFERYVERAATGIRASCHEGSHLSMRFAKTSVPPFRNNSRAVGRGDDCTNQWIWLDIPLPTHGQFKGSLHCR